MTEFMDKLRGGELVLGMNIRHSRTSEAAPILKDCGYDWFMLDNEHTPFSPPQAYETLLAASRCGIAGIVRARNHDPAEIGAQLSNGASGIFVPHVDTAAQALLAARSCKFPPEGILSVPGSFPQLGYRPTPFDVAARQMNERTIVICMIESPEAVSNVDKIAATPGVDVLFIGASDFTYAAGLHGQYDSEVLFSAIKHVCDAARANGKFVGLGGVKTPEQWKRCVKLGVQMLMTENDLSMLIYRATERAGIFRSYKTES